MSFLIFEKQTTLDGHSLLRRTEETFSLAGRALLYKAWEKRGKPINEGWHVTHDELRQLHFFPQAPRDDVRMIIDWCPNDAKKIGLMEPTDIYAYTWGSNGIAEWTPLMLRGRDVFVKDYDPALSAEEKAERTKAIRCDAQGATIIEFLYLHGDERGWIWGKNGTTNAAFLHDAAREYFRQFF